MKRTFDISGKLTSVADRNGNALTLSYNGGLLSSVTDPSGRSLTFSYDGTRISQFTDPMGRTVSFGYSAAGDLISATDIGGASWAYTYSTRHQLLTKVDPNNHTVLNNTYGTLGRVTSQKDAKDNPTAFNYGSGKTTVTDPLGNKTTYYYDTKYRTTSVWNAYGGIVNQTWDDNNNLTRVQDARGRPHQWTYYTYDAHGNLLTRKDNLNQVWTYTYDSHNNLLTEKNPLGHIITYTYDIAGNLAAVTNALNEQTRYGRDVYGQVISITDPLNNTTLLGYDTYGNSTTITNALGLVTIKQYDIVGRLSGQTDPLTHTVWYAYDNGNRLLSTTDALGNVTSYGYDAVGNRTVITDANGISTYYAYDGLNRLTQATYPDSTVTYAYDVLSHRTAMTDTLGTSTYAYDAVGRPITITTPGGLSVLYEYNPRGQRSSLTYPDGKQVQYDYDAAGRLWTVRDWASRVVTYTYDAAGRLVAGELPNGTSTSYAYDNANRLTSLTHTSVVSGTINSFDYALDNVGNRLVMTDTSGVTSYVYDDLYRLTRVTYPDASIVSYEYDAVGNRLAMTDTVGTTSYTYDDADRMQSAGDTTFTWDANGNMRTKVTPSGTITYTYDYANRLTQVATDADTYQYAYDGDGMRVRKTVNGAPTDYLWDKALSLPVVLTDTNALNLHGLRLIAQQSGVDVSYYHPDGLGTIRNLTDSTGQVIVGYEYDAFGGLRSSYGTLTNDFRFTGQQLDSHTNLYYLRARWYDPSLGRFITKDTFVPDYANPRSINRYIYGYDNPLKYVDPSGHFVLLVGGMLTGNDDRENERAWDVIIEELGLDPTHQTGEEWAFFNWGDEPGASSLLPLSYAARRLAEQIACKSDIKIIGHSRGGALAMEYAARVAAYIRASALIEGW